VTLSVGRIVTDFAGDRSDMETSGDTRPMTQCHIAEDFNLQQYRCENPNYRNLVLGSFAYKHVDKKTFYQQIGLKFKKEPSKMLHLELTFARC
jgi:hypothetical protein